MPFVCENREGRLIEVRIDSSLSVEETQKFRTRLWLILSGMEGRGIVIGDLLHAELFSPEVSEKLLEMLKHDNPKLERGAFILRASTAFTMQIERLVGEAAAAATNAGKLPPMRRTFRDRESARSWLDEVLTTKEGARLAAFLAET
jgi:hypothetical protein